MTYSRPALTAILLYATSGTAVCQTTLLATDFSGNKAVRFDYATGEAIDHFIAAGISPLDNSRGMAILPNGLLAVSSFDTDAVYLFSTQTGQFIRTLIPPGAGGLNGPDGLAMGPDGLLYVVSSNNDSVRKFNPETGVFVATAATGIAFPRDIEFTNNNVLLVSDDSGNRIAQFEPSTGAFLGDIDTSGTGINGPTYMTRDSAGNIYVSCGRSDSILIIEDGSDAASLHILPGTGGLDNPLGLAVDDSDNLLAGLGNNSVLIFDANGDYVDELFPPSRDGGLNGLSELLLYSICTADFNMDGSVNSVDVISFLNAWTAGCE